MLRELQRDFAHALFAPHGATVLDSIAADGLDPSRRLFVHYNSIAASLTRVLENTYPALRAMLGTDTFAGAAAQHIRRHPPGSASLLDYGSGFAASAVAMADGQDATMVGEIAAIEWAQKRAFHAADAPVVTRADLSRVPSERMPGLRFDRHPALLLIEVTAAAYGAWCAALELADRAAAGHIAVTRPDTRVHVHGLRPGTHALVAALADGMTLQDAAESAASADPDIDLAGAIGEAVDIGAFKAFHA